MALEIRFGDYGDETVNGQWRKMCVAELYNGPVLIAKRVIQNIADEADRDEKAKAAFAGFDDKTAAEKPPAKPDPTGWSDKLTDPVLPKVEAAEAKVLEK